MNIENLQSMWEQQNAKLDECLKLNYQRVNSELLSTAKNSMHKILFKRLIEAMVCFVIVALLWMYIINHFTFSAPILSAIVLNLFAIVGLASNIGQIALITGLDLSRPVKQVQAQLYGVRAHNIASAKLILLSVPLYMAYVFLLYDLLFGIDLYEQLSSSIKTFYWISSLVLYAPVIYVIRQLRHDNLNTPWVAWLMQELGDRSLMRVASALNQLEDNSSRNK